MGRRGRRDFEGPGEGRGGGRRGPGRDREPFFERSGPEGQGRPGNLDDRQERRERQQEYRERLDDRLDRIDARINRLEERVERLLRGESGARP